MQVRIWDALCGISGLGSTSLVEHLPVLRFGDGSPPERDEKRQSGKVDFRKSRRGQISPKDPSLKYKVSAQNLVYESKYSSDLRSLDT